MRWRFVSLHSWPAARFRLLPKPDAVRARFEQFVAPHPALTAKKIRFLSLLQNHIAKYGTIGMEQLCEDSFTMLHAGGIDGVGS
jgi:type I restriction enzyme R subunit